MKAVCTALLVVMFCAWPGRVEATEYVVVEDFESYENNSELWSVWNDYWVNGSGSEIFLEKDPNIVHDGNKAVMLWYDNSFKIGSEYPGSWMDANPVDLEVGPDWTAGGLNTLVVHFRGSAYNSATVNDKMWLELADTSSNVGLVLYDGDAHDVTEEWWHEWNIDLSLFDACGVDLTEVEWVAIGFGGTERTGQTGPGGDGRVHFDDIRLEHTVTEVNEPVIVEDFESYLNNFELYGVWNDYWVNGSSAEIFLETDPNIVQDSNKAVTLYYYNYYQTGGEFIGAWMDANPVDLEVGPDWTVSGANTLVVHFRGNAYNSATINDKMWLELADTSSNVGLALYDGDADDVTEEWWHEWNIDLGLFDACGVDLTQVEWVAIGFGGTERTGQVEAGGDGDVHFDDIRLEHAGAGIEVSVDIKPEFCPNYLSMNSRGTLSVAILGTEVFDVYEVDVASVRLNGVAAVRHSYEDVATPVADGDECDCTAEGADGYLDLEFAFKIQDLVDTFPDVNGGDVLSLTLEGALTDGTAIEGSDCVIIRGKP